MLTNETFQKVINMLYIQRLNSLNTSTYVIFNTILNREITIMQPKTNVFRSFVTWQMQCTNYSWMNKIVRWDPWDVLKILSQLATVMLSVPYSLHVQITSYYGGPVVYNTTKSNETQQKQATIQQNKHNTLKLVLCVVLWSFFISGCPNKHPAC